MMRRMTPVLTMTSPISFRRMDRLQTAGLLLAVGLHVLVLILAWQRSEAVTVPAVTTLSVRMLPAQVVAEPTPAPPQPRPTPPVERPPAPAPVKRVTRPEPAPVAPVAPTPVQPAEPVIETPSAPTATAADAAPAAAAVVAPRFDAAYLNNPAPVYPVASRRLNESGRVLLRVQVSEQGLPLQVQLHQTSGHARLDQAAQEAVRRWRFVPARRGDVPVSEWVIVPITFSLTR